MEDDNRKAAGMRVAVEYRLSPGTFRRATHAVWKSQASFKVLAAMMGLLWVAANFNLGAGGRLQDQLPVFAYLVMALAFYYLYPSIAFSRDPRNRTSTRLEFTKDRITYRLAGKETAVPWSALTATIETSEFYLLSFPEKLKLAVPKAGFAPDHEQRFRLLAATSGVFLSS